MYNTSATLVRRSTTSPIQSKSDEFEETGITPGDIDELVTDTDGLGITSSLVYELLLKTMEI